MKNAAALLVATVLYAPFGWGQGAARQQDPQPVAVESTQAAPATAATPRQDGPESTPETITIPAGTRFLVTVMRTHDPDSAHLGTLIHLQTQFPVIQEGRIVVPAKSLVYGVVGRRRERGKAHLVFRMSRLIYPNNYTVEISGTVQKVPSVPSNRMHIDAESAGLLGALAGGLIGIAAKSGTGIIAGLFGGAVAGVVIRRATDRERVWLAEDATLEMVLDEALTLDLSRIAA